MNIGQFIASTGWGGAEKAFVNLANGLAASDSVQVIALEGSPLIGRLRADIDVARLPNMSRHNPYIYWALLNILRQRKPDIIHTHAGKASAMVRKLTKFINAKQIATKHNSRKNKLFIKLPHVIAVSQQAKQAAGRHAKIIYNGIIPKPINSQPSHVFTLLAIGRLDPIKGFDRLIKAVAQLDFPFRLQIAGSGPEYAHLLSLAKNSHLNRIDLLGHREDIPELMAAADLIIINSATEGFSLVLMEALFYGRILISTKVGGSVEILSGSLLFESEQLAAKIRQVHTDYKHYQALFTAIKKQYSNQFRIETTIAAHKDYYQQILHYS